MSAYYNEIDPNAAEWLRQLIKLKQIPDGVVDERSIVDVPSNELSEFTQVHFFAGVGVWAYALKQAGWSESEPVWTGSCPCQPFSSAGQRKGADDDRDLWWAMFWHIQQCRPTTVFGEQVASKDGLGWWDTVSSDLEREGYAATAFDLPAASVGKPHIRQRLYWVANPEGPKQESTQHPRGRRARTSRSGSTSSLGDAHISAVGRQVGGLCREKTQISGARYPDGRFSDRPQFASSEFEWIYCRDGKHRPIKPSIPPLAHGATPDMVRGGNTRIQTEATQEARTMRIKGYGNAIVAPLAIEFIKAYMDCRY